MSVTAAIRDLLSQGFTVEQALTAAEAFEPKTPVLTSRQARNARYYEAHKERLKASEIKTSEKSEIETIKTVSDAGLVSPVSPPRDIKSTPPSSPSISPEAIASSSTVVDPKAAKAVVRSESDQKLLDQITDVWNRWAASHRCPQVKFLTKSRGQQCRNRLADITNGAGPVAAFEKLLSKCETSFFVRGSPRSPLTFDRLMTESFMVKMLEGAFENGKNQGSFFGSNTHR